MRKVRFQEAEVSFSLYGLHNIHYLRYYGRTTDSVMKHIPSCPVSSPRFIGHCLGLPYMVRILLLTDSNLKSDYYVPPLPDPIWEVGDAETQGSHTPYVSSGPRFYPLILVKGWFCLIRGCFGTSKACSDISKQGEWLYGFRQRDPQRNRGKDGNHFFRLLAGDGDDPGLRHLAETFLPGCSLGNSLPELRAHPTGPRSDGDLCLDLDGLCGRHVLHDPRSLRNEALERAAGTWGSLSPTSPSTSA